ncbi:Protein involved in catabolism of external DNA [Thioalkalivibrio nitratireducens DSM 14787]|uniref:Ribosomal RNA large subunit methyltransferase J n=1 Tax=Thioalkalivibrio nitratireducens (strain DSM 14787 / UNIQEM 213 / ALEN2) TaxID=1255043 RepID=L0E173_THIND|nr:23S rRNA (adenine(2030)-N(6))-methyltransferase RlmJ [Thioalkalivibrio nitratireducens]AGA35053.1 Protein involved in catabolism of external DNA [Thioalkalivibrio nitratireducens DSM 14787]
MLSYQHQYHAGNSADVHKHLLLWLVLDALLSRPKPFVVLDLYAGSGEYPLTTGAAARSGEWRAGIGRLWDLTGGPAPLQAFLAALRGLQPRPGELTRYPGSPQIARLRLRAQDRLIACELHPAAHAALRAGLRVDRRCHVHRRDAREAARALFPPEPRRGMALLDPAYERPAEYTEVPQLTAEIRRRWNTGILLVWYPVLEDGRHPRLREALRAGHAGERIVFSELRLTDPPRGPGLQGSGIAVIGAPWQLDLQARQVLFPAWRRLDPEGRGGLFQALALENSRGRPHLVRVQNPDPPDPEDVKDYD